jgi:DNA-directed RNA polymerase subunit beta
MQSLALDVNVVSEEGERAEMREEDDDLLRAAEELGIDLSGVRATDGQAADETTDEDAEPAEDSEEEAEVEDPDIAATEDVSADDFDAEANGDGDDPILAADAEGVLEEEES